LYIEFPNFAVVWNFWIPGVPRVFILLKFVELVGLLSFLSCMPQSQVECKAISETRSKQHCSAAGAEEGTADKLNVEESGGDGAGGQGD
jgi:hypothetical protein